MGARRETATRPRAIERGGHEASFPNCLGLAVPHRGDVGGRPDSVQLFFYRSYLLQFIELTPSNALGTGRLTLNN